MSVVLLLAAALAIVTALVHAWLGGREVLRPALAAGLSSVPRGTIEAAWHLLTWHFVLLGLLFAYGAYRGGGARALAAVVGGLHALGYAVIFLAVSLGRFRSPLRLPQWILFLPMSLLAFSGAPPGVALTPSIGDCASVVAAATLAALSVLHLAWAAGSPWPEASRGELARLVVGVGAGGGMPGVVATILVAVGLAVVAALALAARGLLPGPPLPAAHVLLWIASAVFALRGLAGFFEPALRPMIRGTPYMVWNARLYSPLALGLAVSLAAAAASPS